MLVSAINRIWEKVFDDSGEHESGNGSVERCPGESCEQFSSRFLKTKGRWKDRAEEACAGCGKCDGKIPLKPNRNVQTDELTELIDEIGDIVEWENAGHSTAWEIYPFEYQILHKTWRKAERQVKEIREMRMQAFIKGWMSQ